MQGCPDGKTMCVKYAKTYDQNDPTQSHVEITKDSHGLGFKTGTHIVDPN